MTEVQMLVREINTLRACLRFDHVELQIQQLGAEERAGVVTHAEMCVEELKSLLQRLGSLKAKDRGRSKL